MKTVEDAVRQENGVWLYDERNAMARLCGDINYISLDDCGVLHCADADELNAPATEAWRLVCTREEFEAKAKEMGYGANESDDDMVDSEIKESANQESVITSQDQLTTDHSVLLLLAYLQGQADAGIKYAQMALEYYHGLNKKTSDNTYIQANEVKPC